MVPSRQSLRAGNPRPTLRALVTSAFVLSASLLILAGLSLTSVTAGNAQPIVGPGPSLSPALIAPTDATPMILHQTPARSTINLNFVRMGYAPAATPAGSASHSRTALTPGCASTYCPMGITDYGITPTLGTYSYKFAVAASWFDTGSSFSIGAQSGSGGCLDSDAETGYCVTVQQNTLVHQVNVENSLGTYWVQNVPEIAYDKSCSTPCVSGTFSVTWLDNIWNFSSKAACHSATSGGAGCMNSAHISGDLPGSCSASGIPTTGSNPYAYYYCVGPTVYDLSPPFTIQTFTSPDVSLSSCTPSTSTTCITFYGAITSGPSVLYGGYYDAVSFAAGSLGAGSPYGQVSSAKTPLGLPSDFEWVFGGPGGGSTGSVDTQGDLQSLYCQSACAGITTYKALPHTWSSGADTGESVQDVEMIIPFNVRDLAQVWDATDNPQTSLW